MKKASRSAKVKVAIVLALALVVALVVTGVTSGFGDPAVPDDDVAVVDGVDDGTVSKDDFDAAMKEGAEAGGLTKVPAEDSDQYPQLVQQVMQQLLLPIWVGAEAEELGVSVDEDDVTAEFEKQKKQAGIKTPEDLQKILDQQGITEEDVTSGIRDTLLQAAVLAEVAPGGQNLPEDIALLPQDQQIDRLAEHYGISDQDVQSYYDEAKDMTAEEGGFTTPPTREARVILNTSEKKINEAKAALEKGDLSDETWTKVAKKYSQDQTSAATGGALPAAVIQGAAAPSPYEEQVFDAPVGELVGPVETSDNRGFLLLQVTKAKEAKTKPLDDNLKQQITAMIINNREQEAFADFQSDFFDKWVGRTVCDPVAVSEFCSNFEPTDPEVPEGQPEPPAVQAPQPIEPGTAEIPLSFPQGYQPPLGEHPQGPAAGVQLPPTPTVPAGAATIGPDGQPIPGATAPPTGTTAPPTGTTAPPTGSTTPPPTTPPPTP